MLKDFIDKDNALRALNAVEHKMNTLTRSPVTLNGVSNLSYSDLQSAHLYIEAYLRTGTFGPYMEPLGEVKDLLESYGIVAPKKGRALNAW